MTNIQKKPNKLQKLKTTTKNLHIQIFLTLKIIVYKNLLKLFTCFQYNYFLNDLLKYPLNFQNHPKK